MAPLVELLVVIVRSVSLESLRDHHGGDDRETSKDRMVQVMVQ
jgi:hypothetical protein